MSKEVKIFVGERQLDLYDGVSIPLNFNISDVSEITKRAGSFSRTIKIPATANNNEIMGFGNNLKSRFREEGEGLEEGALTQILKENARVEANGLTIFTGFIKPLGGTINKDGCYSEYSINVFADNNDWVSVAKEKNLKDLDWSIYDHTYSKITIDFAEAVGNTSLVQYPLINFGKFSRNGGRGVAVEDRVPAWRLKDAFENVFKEQGYTIESNFIDSEFFKSLYVPTVGKFELTDEEIAALEFTETTPIVGEFDPLYALEQTELGVTELDKSGTFTSGRGRATSTYHTAYSKTIGLSGFRTITASVDYVRVIGDGVNEFSGSSRFRFELWWVRGATESRFADFFEAEEDNLHFQRNITISTPSVNFQVGDKIEVRINLGGIQKITPNSGNELTYSQITVEAEGSKKVPEGHNIDFKNLIIDVTQLEFVQAVTQLFNLYYYANVDTNKIFIEPRDDFYFDSNTAIDWSDKVDNNKDCSIKYLGDNLKKNLVYKYKKDSKDEYVDYWEIENKKELAAETVILDNKFTSGTEDNENKIFSPTFMDFDPSIGFTKDKIPKMWSDVPDGDTKPPFSTHFNPRLLYLDGVVNMADLKTWDWAGTKRTDYLRFYSYFEALVNETSLNFNNTIGGVGLVRRYYRNTHKLINRGKKVELYLNLTDIDIVNFDFRQIVYIDGCYYYVETIKDYDTTVKQTTKVELITLVDFDPIGTTNETLEIRNISRSRWGRRRGSVPLSSDFEGNLVGGVDNETNGYENTLLLGCDLEATNDSQTMIGCSKVLADEVIDDSPFVIAGMLNDCNNPDIKDGRPLLQFSRDGNMLIGGGEIYTSCGNRVLYHNDTCDLQPILKDNANN